MYEGYGPHGIAIVVETATDNNQRTVAQRAFLLQQARRLSRHPGSLSFLFDHKSVFHVKPNADTSLEDFELELMDF